MIFKFLLISILIIYLLARFWGFFYRVIAAFQGKDIPPKFQQNKTTTKKKYDTRAQGNLRIFIPKKQQSGSRNKSGEYVDYKEIKEE